MQAIPTCICMINGDALHRTPVAALCACICLDIQSFPVLSAAPPPCTPSPSGVLFLFGSLRLLASSCFDFWHKWILVLKQEVLSFRETVIIIIAGSYPARQ
jgi:hypothetical protein